MDAILGSFICTTEQVICEGGSSGLEWFERTFIEQDLERVMSLAEGPGWCPLLVLSRDESRWRLFTLHPEEVDLPPRLPVRPN